MHYVRNKPQSEVWYNTATVCFIPPTPQGFANDLAYNILFINKHTVLI